MRAEGEPMRLHGAVPKNVSESASVTAAFESVDRRLRAYRTNYDAVVPLDLRADVATKVLRWIEEGRSDLTINNLIESAVLAAYARGRSDG